MTGGLNEQRCPNPKKLSPLSFSPPSGESPSKSKPLGVEMSFIWTIKLGIKMSKPIRLLNSLQSLGYATVSSHWLPSPNGKPSPFMDFPVPKTLFTKWIREMVFIDSPLLRYFPSAIPFGESRRGPKKSIGPLTLLSPLGDQLVFLLTLSLVPLGLLINVLTPHFPL